MITNFGSGFGANCNIQDSPASWCSAFRLLQRFLSGFSFQNAKMPMAFRPALCAREGLWGGAAAPPYHDDDEN